MTHPHIAIGALGGTISMTPDAAAGGVTPELTAEQLAASVPGLSELARISAATLAQLPSAALKPAHVLAALNWAEQQIAAGAVGVVLTQGTDSIEETAYLLDLCWSHAEPLIVTGAMRAPLAAGADGPANLLAAVLAARAPHSRGRGVMVVMNDTVHAARWVRKRHSLAVQAFESPESGPLGTVVEGRCHYWQGAAPRLPALVPVGAERIRVALLNTWLGDDGELAEAALQAGYDGLVVAGFGAGHVSFGFAERMRALCEALPVVIAGRTGAGPAATATYGYVGSEVDLLGRGAMMAGWLSPLKARLLLWALLASGTTRAGLPKAWQRYSGIEEPR